MKIALTSTNQMTTVDEVPARVWEGVTEGGVRCLVFVCRIAVPAREDVSQFEAELKETLPPAEMLPLRHVLR